MIRAVICDDEDAALKIITYSIENQGRLLELLLMERKHLH